MSKGTAGFLSFLAGLVAIAAVAWLAAPHWFGGAVQPPETTAVSTSSETASEKPADAAPAATEMAKADTKSDRIQPGPVPTFDVLRVEPDGSMVLAGKAAAGSRIELMNGDAVIASETVGAMGDFAIILDEPLPAGDYQLTLRSTAGDGTTQLSEEVATVAIPEGGQGELLAMVTRPGEPSRILAQPTAPVEAATATETASADPSASSGAAGSATPAADAATAAPAAGGSEPATQSPATDAPADTAANPAATTGGDSAAVVLPELPETSTTLVGTAPEMPAQTTETASATTAPETESDAQASGTGMAAPAAEAAATAPSAAEAAAAAPSAETASAAVTAAPAADATVRVDAVEIEGDMIFIAGSATAGYTVQVSADGVAIGSSVADANGRFIVEAKSALSVGDHTISADLIAPDSTAVVLRASVPFTRPEGNAVAAVAGSAQQDAAAASAGSLRLPELASLDGLRSNAFGALTNLSAKLAADAPNTADLAEAKADLVRKLETVISAPVPDTASAEARAGAEAVRDQARVALAAIEPMELGADNLPDMSEMQAMRDSVGDAMAGLSRPVMPSAQGTETTAASTTGPAAMPSPDLRDLGGMREQAYRALSAYGELLEGGSASDEDLARARAEAVAKLQAVIDANDAASQSAETTMAADGIQGQAAAALAALQSAGATPDAASTRQSVAAALGALATPSDAMVAAVAGQPAAKATAAASTDGPATINQAPLTQSPHAVIIRRGDTLWQISRRTYGEGVRYTTIYLANLSQIQNPDRIKPGQVFSVPDKPLSNAAELHRKRLEEMKKQ
ncbi:LysM domain-containing protein [Hoeflea marina]|uniref:LysM domain-containing protein n=1 Tax=Hoeflea marina TaxID=274592 RepID=A0A317PH13_9HYPH|nr:LysM peptidoglycan-binding domain-containing protein [Hoeflea marina]PWV98738.1 LysM domain-containing protein [Hoeflea marina]